MSLQLIAKKSLQSYPNTLFSYAKVLEVKASWFHNYRKAFPNCFAKLPEAGKRVFFNFSIYSHICAMRVFPKLTEDFTNFSLQRTVRTLTCPCPCSEPHPFPAFVVVSEPHPSVLPFQPVSLPVSTFLASKPHPVAMIIIDPCKVGYRNYSANFLRHFYFMEWPLKALRCIMFVG